MHGFLPALHVDHLHPDALIAFAAAADGPERVADAFGGRLGWLGWQRPGFDLGLRLRDLVAAQPDLVGVVLGGHGVISWADTSEESEALSLSLIEQAERYLAEQGRPQPFGSPRAGYGRLPDAERRQRAAALAPVVRGLASTDRHVVGRLTDSDVVLDFLASEAAPRLAALGTSCPDHFLRTKVRPLLLDVPADSPVEDAAARLRELHAQYRDDYRSYYEAQRDADDAPNARRGSRDRAPPRSRHVELRCRLADGARGRRVLRQRDQRHARRRGALVVRADLGLREVPRRVLGARGAQASPAPALAAADRPHRLRHRRGVGNRPGDRETIARPRRSGRHRRPERGSGPPRGRRARDTDRVLAVAVDVSDEQSVTAALDATALRFGGVDIVVNNAGLASSAPLLETEAADYDRLARRDGTRLLPRQPRAARVLVEQGVGGDIVYIASKNAVFAGPNNVAYGSVEGGQAHQVRLLAAELGPHRIRVNGVHPDAVVRGSGIFAGDWAEERAEAYGVPVEELGRFYAERTLLKTEILPEHIADAVATLVGGDLSVTTGTFIPVDGGIPAAFPR